MSGLESSLAARASAWRDADPDPETRAELDQLLANGDAGALAERFEGTLAFGTAGIRAAMGAGPMRMNRLVAGRVAAGLARYLAAGLVLVLGARAGLAQTAADHIAKGDSAHSALHAPEAYAHYKEAIALDSNDYEALWKASREAVDLGEFEPDKAKQKAYYAEGQQYAERAVAVKPNDPEGHFNLARALEASGCAVTATAPPP